MRRISQATLSLVYLLLCAHFSIAWNPDEPPSVLNKCLQTFESIASAESNAQTFCTLYQRQPKYTIDGKPVSWFPWDNNNAAAQCKAACPNPDPNKVHSYTCDAIKSANYWWLDMSSPDKNFRQQSAQAPCLCNNDLIDELADDFVKALPAVGQAVCEVWVGALTGFVDFFIDIVIDSLEQAMSAVQNLGAVNADHRFFALNADHQNIIQSALLMNQTYSTLEKGRDAFGKFISSKVCLQGALSAEQSNQIYSAIYYANWWVVTAITIPEGIGEAANALRISQTPKWARGLNPPDSALPKAPPQVGPPPPPIRPSRNPPDQSPHNEKPPPKSKPKPTEKPKTTDKPDPTSTAHKSTTSACQRKNGKRGNDPKGKGKDDDCKKTIHKIVHSEAMEKPITQLCDGRMYTQACTHYSSAAKVAGRKASGRPKNINTKWEAFTKAEYFFNGKTPKARTWKPPNCQADEWPPSYWVPENEGTKEEWGQQIRWAPGSENGGAAGAWTRFCTKQDGGKGNAQKGIPEAKRTKGKKGAELEEARAYSQKLEEERPPNSDVVKWDPKDVEVLEKDKGTVTSI